MHDRKNEHRYKNLPGELAERGFKQPVLCPEARGDKFVLRKGTVRPN